MLRSLVLVAAFTALSLVRAGDTAPAPDAVRAAAGSPPTDTVAQVDVFTGTSNSRWMLFPGATRPFGLVKLSPDNQTNVWNGGYEYTVASVSGFSHLHAYVLSGVSLMPVTGPMETSPGSYRVFPGSPDGPFGGMWTSGYRSRIRKDTERGSPGYYAADLIDFGVHAETTATPRTGALRLTYPAGSDAHLLLDFDAPAEEQCRILEAVARRTAPNEITGHVRQSNNYTGIYTVNFVVRTSVPLASVDAWQLGTYTGDSTSYGIAWRRPVDFKRGVAAFSGKDSCGIVLNLDTSADRTVIVQTGISLVDEAGARRNLDTETKPFVRPAAGTTRKPASASVDFDAMVTAARADWADRIGAVEVSGGSAEARRMFATCLYRAYSAKSLLSDVDGRYVDHTTGEIRQLANAGAEVYSSDAVWGSQWTLFPLWTLTSPATAQSWVRFFLECADRNGWMPQAPVLGGYGPVMVAQHEQALIVSSYQKGIRGFDAERAFRAIKHDLTTPGTPMPNGGYAGDRQLTSYLQHGYVPHEDGPTSNTFEYAYDDWVAAQFARALGKNEDYAAFLRRSRSFRNALNPATGYAQPRHADGSWLTPFDPFRFGTEGGWNGPGFVEGNAWIYTWFVPQDPAALIAFMGGREPFNRRLEEGLIRGYADLGNETDLHLPFLFNYSGKPWLAQKYVRQTLATAFDTSPLGGWLKGEEDEGQMSALYVLWSLGLFEIDGGCSPRPYYDLVAPQFDRVVIHLDSRFYPGRQFVILTHHNGPQNPYIQSARLNGRPLTRAWLYHDELVAGGTLEFDLGPQPNPKWGTGPGDAPPLLQHAGE